MLLLNLLHDVVPVEAGILLLPIAAHISFIDCIVYVSVLALVVIVTFYPYGQSKGRCQGCDDYEERKSHVCWRRHPAIAKEGCKLLA